MHASPLTARVWTVPHRGMTKPHRTRRRIISAAIILIGGPLLAYLWIEFGDPAYRWATGAKPTRNQPQLVGGPPCTLVPFDPADPEQRGTCDMTCDAGTLKPMCLPWALAPMPGKRTEGFCKCSDPSTWPTHEKKNPDGGSP